MHVYVYAIIIIVRHTKYNNRHESDSDAMATILRRTLTPRHDLWMWPHYALPPRHEELVVDRSAKPGLADRSLFQRCALTQVGQAFPEIRGRPDRTHDQRLSTFTSVRHSSGNILHPLVVSIYSDRTFSRPSSIHQSRSMSAHDITIEYFSPLRH